ncbi:MFS transporter [Pseudonocardia kongjuensis]|uniref:MFS transporter n=1 Tax=Pseudonocardia kongjuensis TaxID=102227 RepID=A0ABP4IEY0_9PSEU
MTPPPQPGTNTDEQSVKARRAAWGAFAGTAIEWYDFYVYGTAAALVIGRLFFPDADPLAQTLSALATFAIGFVLRPVGAVLFGYIGDRVSRKTSLLITLVMMGGATVAIGCLPTYESIGVAAPIMLLVLRMIQGLSVGGEWGGAVLIASEAAPAHRKVLAASMAQVGAPVGSILSTGVFLLLPSGDALFDFWWRVPFLLSGTLLVVGLVIRIKLEENEEFVAARERKEAAAESSKVPVLELLRRFPLTNICVFVASFAVSGVYFRNVFALNWATETQGVARDVFLNALLIGALIQVIATPLAAIAADRIGVRRAQIIFTVVYLVVAPIPMLALISTGNTGSVYLAIVLSYIGHAVYYATLSGFLTTLFPTELRYTGISFGYQLSGSLVSGFVPLVAAALVGVDGTRILPVQLLYGALIAFSLIGILLGTAMSRRETAAYEAATGLPSTPAGADRG